VDDLSYGGVRTADDISLGRTFPERAGDVVDSDNPFFDDDDEDELAPAALPSFGREASPKSPELFDDEDDFELPSISMEHMDTGMAGHQQHAPAEDAAFSPIDDELERENPFMSITDDAIGELLEAVNGGFDEPEEQPGPTPIHDITGQLDSLGNLDDPEGLSGHYAELSGGLTDDDDEDDEYAETFIDLDKVITLAIEHKASDIHIYPEDDVAFTILGEIYRFDEFGVIDANMTTKLQQRIISNVLEQDFVENLELDTSYVVETGKYKGRRLRLSVGKEGGAVTMTFRVIADVMPTPEAIGVPGIVQSWFKLPAGMILVNGPTGSGKSTTLSSLMQVIQFSKRKKVITLEKPVEFKYGNRKPGQKAFFAQREVGRDTRSFKNGIVSAMRQAPNIILVGEVRFKDEIDELLAAAETGHLAISTLHTVSCAQTINRIRSMYDGDDQKRVLATIADNLRGMVTQALVPSPDGTKRVAVFETLQITRELKPMLLEGDAQGIRRYMEDRGITMEHELVKAARAGVVDLEEARNKAPDPLYFDELYEA